MERPRRGTNDGGGNRGSVVVWVSLLLIPVLGFVALAVDTGAYMIRADRLRQLADEAALAGARELSQILADQNPAFLDLGNDRQYTLTNAGVNQIQTAAMGVLTGRFRAADDVAVDVGRWQTRANGTFRYVENNRAFSNAVRVSITDTDVGPLVGRLFHVPVFRMGATGTAAITQRERMPADSMGMPFAVSQAWFTRQNRQKEPKLQWNVMGPNEDFQCLAINTYEMDNWVDTASRDFHDISCLLKGGNSGGCRFLGWVTGNDYDKPREFICRQDRITDLERIVCSFWGIGSGAHWRPPAAQTIFTDPPPNTFRRTCDGDATIECTATQELRTYVDQMNDQVCRDRCNGQNCGNPCCQDEGIWEADCYGDGFIDFLEDVFDSIDSLSHSDAKVERAMWDNFIMVELANFLKDGSGMTRDRLDASVTQCPAVEIDGRTVPGSVKGAYGKCHHVLDTAVTRTDRFFGREYYQERTVVELVRLYGDYTENLPVYEDTSGGGQCQVPDGPQPIVGFVRANIEEMSFLKVSEESRDRGLFSGSWSDWEPLDDSEAYKEFRDAKVEIEEAFAGADPASNRPMFSPDARLRGTVWLAPKLVN